MKAIDRKLLRDLGRLRGQVFTIALVVACGIGAYLASVGTYRSLIHSRDAYYESSRFADVFAQVQRAPMPIIERIRELPGVAIAEARVVKDMRLDIPTFPEPVQARFVSINPEDPAALNLPFMREGRMVEKGRADEVVLSELFARAHELRPGETITAVINGRRTRLRVVGIALSPEYVWVMPEGGFASDDKRLGIAWMDRQGLASALRMEGAFNDVAISLAPGASREQVIADVDRLLEPYGSYGAVGRDRQTSNRLVTQEIGQLKTTALMLPLIFLGVAAFLLNVVLARIVSTQREQIAALKALGYGNAAVGWHYVKLALVMVSAGSVLGLALGIWVGRMFTRIYTHYFHFPSLDYRLDPDVAFNGVAISFAAAIIGALASVRRAARLPPAEAMRPEPPAVYRRTALERLGLDRLLAPVARMIVRDLERQGVRTALSSLGIALATGILVVGNMAFDSVERMIALQFSVVDREDLAVAFVTPIPDRERRALETLPGVVLSERLRSVPVRIRAGARSRELGLLAVEPGATLRRPIDQRMEPFEVSPSGITISRALAGILGVRVGDAVDVEVLEGSRPRRELVVSALVDDLLGLSAYMPAAELDRFLDQSPLASGALLSIDPRQRDLVMAELNRRPGVVQVTRREHARELFRKQTADVFLTYQLVLGIFAGIIAVGVVYNNARIALAMRSRDLATLRILGFTRAEVSSILLGEQAVQLLIGIPLGLPLGEWLSRLMLSTADPELFRLPLALSSRTRATAVIVVLLASAASAFLVRRRADRLDLVGVLKARD